MHRVTTLCLIYDGEGLQQSKERASEDSMTNWKKKKPAQAELPGAHRDSDSSAVTPKTKPTFGVTAT